MGQFAAKIANRHEIKELKAIHNKQKEFLRMEHIANRHEIKELKAIHNIAEAATNQQKLRIVTKLKN